MSLQLINQHSKHIKEQYSELEELAYQKRILVSGFERQCKKSRIFEKMVIKESLHLREDEKCTPSCSDIENEYQIASKLTHDNILNPTDYSKQYKGGCAIYFPRASCDAFHYFVERSTKEKKMVYTLAEVKHLIKSITLALRYLHEGENIAHNDIKLENFLCFISEDNDYLPTFMLTDFGYSYEIQNNSQSESELLLCSSQDSSSSSYQCNSSKKIEVFPKWRNRVKRYLSPELVESINKQSIMMGLEKKSDIISLGFVLYTLTFLDSMVGSNEKEYAFCKKYNKIQAEGIQFLQTLNCRIETESEKKEQLFDLILRMTERNPAKRIDACGILNHPWLN